MQTALPLVSGLTTAEKATLWAAADKLRGHLDAAEYNHVVLGLIFLKNDIDAVEEHPAAPNASPRRWRGRRRRRTNHSPSPLPSTQRLAQTSLPSG